MLDQRERLLRASAVARDQSLRVQGLGQDLGQPERLGDLDRDVDPRCGELDLALEEVQPAKLGREGGEVVVGLVPREHREGTLHPLERLLQLSQPPLDLAEPRGDPGGRMGQALSLVQLQGTLVVHAGLLRSTGGPGGRAGALTEPGLGERIVGELGGPLEVVLRLLVRRQRRRPLARPGERLQRLDPDLIRVVRVRRRVVGVEVVRGDHLDDLLLAGAEGLYEMSRRSEVAGSCARPSRASRRRRA